MRKILVPIKTYCGLHMCIFESDKEKGGVIVTARDLPGVITWGKNLTEAKKMAKEALELCIECLVDEQIKKVGKHLFRPRSSSGAKIAERV